MIRTKTKIYGELNDSDTLLGSSLLPKNKYLVYAGTKQVKLLPSSPGRILIVSLPTGGVNSFDFGSSPNRLIGTTSTGVPSVLDHPIISVIPPNRELVFTFNGNDEPTGAIQIQQFSFSSIGYYEVEVFGAGGGGGGGAVIGLSNMLSSKGDGGAGGEGGYYSTVFYVNSLSNTALLSAGNAGGAGTGWIVAKTGSGLVNITGNSKGGYGGKQHRYFTDAFNNRLDGNNAVYGNHGLRFGGGLVSEDSMGGNAYDAYVLSGSPGAGAAGGGSIGIFGGEGGDALGAPSSISADIRFVGGAGGAGGSLGVGGAGGGNINSGSSTLVPGPFSYDPLVPSTQIGAGGGGGNTFYSIASALALHLSGAGGGGGGGSFFQYQDLIIICGGGGGGAGGGIASNTAAHIINGKPGRNNKDSNVGGGSVGGVKGFGLAHDIIDDMPGNSQETLAGGNGFSGRIKIWKRVL